MTLPFFGLAVLVGVAGAVWLRDPFWRSVLGAAAVIGALGTLAQLTGPATQPLLGRLTGLVMVAIGVAAWVGRQSLGLRLLFTASAIIGVVAVVSPLAVF